MKIILPLILLAITFATPSIALDKETKLEIKRLNETISRLQQSNSRMRQDVRSLQRNSDTILQDNEEIKRKLEGFMDDYLKVTNTDIANLKANQQKLFNDMPILNWGTEKRDCPKLGQHQQIKNVTSADGNYTLRYLCYDGRTLHLGTEVHQPPKE